MDFPAEHEKNVFGQFDEYVKKIERALNVTIISRDGKLKILGNETSANQAQRVISQLLMLSKRGNTITEQNVDYTLSLTFEEKEDRWQRWTEILSATLSMVVRSSQKHWDKSLM